MPPDNVLPIRPQQSPNFEGEELGVTLNVPFGSFSREIPNPAEEGLPDLLDRLDKMQRTDGHARCLYRLLTLPLRRTKWSIKAADGGEKEADFIKNMFERPPHEGGMSTSFDYVRAQMGRSVVTGFSLFEKVYEVAEVPDFGQAVVLKKLAHRDQKTLRFRADDNGGFNGVVQRAYHAKKGYIEVTIPKEKCFFWNVDKEDHPFYGRSYFEPGLYHYDKKHKLYWILHIAAQLGAVPGRLGYLDRDDLTPKEKQNLRQALASFGFNTAMLVPPGVRIEPFESSSPDIVAKILETIHHHNVQMSQAVLGQFIDLAQGASATGSFALSKDGSDLFLMSEETLLTSQAEHISWYLIPELIDLNFNTRKYPTFEFEPLADDMAEAMTTIFEAIAVAPQVNASPDFLFELERHIADRFGLGIDYDALEEERLLQQDAETQAGLDTLEAVKTALKNKPPTKVGPSGEKVDPITGKPIPPAVAAAEAQAQILLAESKRDRLGQFSAVNELGQGAGFKAKGQDQHKALVTDIQARLSTLGFDLAQFGTDGLFGTVTASAVKSFQKANGLGETGRVDLATYAMLLESAPDAAKPEAAAAPAKAKAPPKGKIGPATTRAERIKRLRELKTGATSAGD